MSTQTLHPALFTAPAPTFYQAGSVVKARSLLVAGKELTKTIARMDSTSMVNGMGNVENIKDLDKVISTRTQAALDLKADITSQTLKGIPKAPTAALGTNTEQLATTAFVFSGLELKGNLTGCTYTGDVLGVTATAGDSSKKFATTEFVMGVAGLKANALNAALTGIPVAPTAAVGTNTLQVATTGFVFTGLALKASLTGCTFTGAVSGVTPSLGDNSTKFATTNFVSTSLSTGLGTISASSIGLGNVTNTSDAAKVTSGPIFDALNTKAYIGGSASHAFYVPTVTSTLNDSNAASTAFVKTVLDNNLANYALKNGSASQMFQVASVSSAASDNYAASTYWVKTVIVNNLANYALKNGSTSNDFSANNIYVANNVSYLTTTNRSDEKLKDILGVNQAGYGFNKLLALLPDSFIKYTLKQDADKPNKRTFHGFSAQKLQVVIPEIISESTDVSGNVYLSYDPTALIAYLVDSVRVLNSRILALEGK